MVRLSNLDSLKRIGDFNWNPIVVLHRFKDNGAIRSRPIKKKCRHPKRSLYTVTRPYDAARRLQNTNATSRNEIHKSTRKTTQNQRGLKLKNQIKKAVNVRKVATNRNKYPSRPDEDVNASATATSETQDSSPVLPSTESNLKTYERLMLSLQSPFPNEYQYALEVCARLSVTEGHPRLNVIQDTPGLVDALLAHAGIYGSCASRTHIEESYKAAFGENFDFSRVWNMAFQQPRGEDIQEELEHEALKGQLLCECFQGEFLRLQMDSSGKVVKIFDISTTENTEKIRCCEGCSAMVSIENTVQCPFQFAPGWVSDLDDATFRRIKFVGDILRNFSMEEGNAKIMAKSRTLLRFLLVSVQIEYSGLAKVAYDTIGSIFKSMTGSHEQEWDSTLCQLFGMIWNLLTTTVMESTVNFRINRSLEALSGLAKLRNHRINVTPALLRKIFALLIEEPNVVLKINCLECLYTVTNRGKEDCNMLLRLQYSTKILVNFVTCRQSEGVPSYDAVTKSIRYTTALILRNLTQKSSEARRELRRYQSQLAVALMDGQEPSGALGYVLDDLNPN